MPLSTTFTRRPITLLLAWAPALCVNAQTAAPRSPPAAASIPASTPSTSDLLTPQAQEGLSVARSSVRAATLWLASGVDSWFGDRPFAEGGEVRDGQLSVQIVQREREDPALAVRFNARFRLPNLNRLTYVFVGRDDPQEFVNDQPGALARRFPAPGGQFPDRSFFAGLGRTLDEDVDVRLGLRGRLQLYAQARWRHLWQLDERNAVDLRETVFWTTADRIGSTTALSYEHTVSPSLAWRWVSAATVTQALPKIAWSSIAGRHQTFGAQRVLSLEALINGQQGSGVGASDYGLQARWEQPIHQDWAIGGLMVGRFWPRPDPISERRATWAIGSSLRLRF